MSKAKKLVDMFLIYPIQMKWVRAIPVSVVDLNFSPPSWLWWIKSLDMTWNWSLSPITFSISFPSVLRSTIGLKDLGESYAALLSFEIKIVIKFLKWLGQYPISIQALAIAMMFPRYVLSLTTYLRYSHNNLSGLGADELLYLTMALVNSSSKNGDHDKKWYRFNSFNTFSSTWQNWAVLNEEWRACQRSFNSKHRQPLYLIISMAGRLHLLTQLMSSQGPCFLLVISWIFWSKKALFVFLTVFWKVFQSSIFFKDLYFARSLLQLSFHQLFECFIMLTIFEFFIHADSTMSAKLVMTFSNWWFSKMFNMSNFAKDTMTSLLSRPKKVDLIYLFFLSFFIFLFDFLFLE